MTINDIIALANAGFNAQQIAQFAQVQQTQQFVQGQPAQQAQQFVQGQPAQQVQGQPAQQAQQFAQLGYDPFNMIMNKLGGIQQTMQAGNIMGMNMTPPQENTDTILASIINPPQKGDGK